VVPLYIWRNLVIGSASKVLFLLNQVVVILADDAAGIFHFTNWWMVAAGALLVACCGLATVITLHLTDGPTPIGVRKFQSVCFV
jgi:hypothetical protein